jgi:hypothetical protein
MIVAVTATVLVRDSRVEVTSSKGNTVCLPPGVDNGTWKLEEHPTQAVKLAEARGARVPTLYKKPEGGARKLGRAPPYP